MSGTQLIDAARRALVDDRRQLTIDELAALAALPDDDVPALAEAAHAVRVAWCGDTVELEGILSAKTGGCPEDCHFCSQSSRFDSPVKAVPLLTHDEVIRAAHETAELGASEFCLVYAVRGPDERLIGERQFTRKEQERLGLGSAEAAVVAEQVLECGCLPGDRINGTVDQDVRGVAKGARSAEVCGGVWPERRQRVFSDERSFVHVVDTRFPNRDRAVLF